VAFLCCSMGVELSRVVELILEKWVDKVKTQDPPSQPRVGHRARFFRVPMTVRVPGE
jgi:hypothetical protein